MLGSERLVEPAFTYPIKTRSWPEHVNHLRGVVK